MKRLVFGLAACVAIGLCGWGAGLRGDEPVKDQPKPDPAKELASLQKEWADAQQAFFKAIQEAKTNEDRQKVLKEKRPKPDDFANRFLKIAETNPNSPEANQALSWLLAQGGDTEAGKKARKKLDEKLAAITDLDELQKTLSGLPPYALMGLAPQIAEKVKKNLDHPQAASLLMLVCSSTAYAGNTELGKLYDSTVDLLMERFPERKELAPLTNWLPRDLNPEWGEKHLLKLIEKTSDDDIRVNARFGLASLLMNKNEASQPEAEKLFQKFIDEFANVPARKQKVEEAKKELDDIKLRGIGKPVPDIAGDDLDSKEFKLSDYKGKVILLDFWAFW
jgi:hypothetical protein